MQADTNWDILADDDDEELQLNAVSRVKHVHTRVLKRISQVHGSSQRRDLVRCRLCSFNVETPEWNGKEKRQQCSACCWDDKSIA
jgi:hypothetical protein